MPRRASATSFGGKAGNPQNKTIPGTGRPPDAFYIRLKAMLERKATVKNLEAIMDDPDHPQFMRAVEFASDRAHGKPTQGVDMTSKGEKLGGVIIMPPPEPAKETKDG